MVDTQRALPVRAPAIQSRGRMATSRVHSRRRNVMSKRARKRRDRKKNAASHGKRPNT